MEYFRSDVKSGLFILIAFFCFIFGIFMIGGVLEKFKSSRKITLYFENSQQVDEGTDVLYRGKKVGQVSGVSFAQDGIGVDIICDVDPRTKLYKGTKARIGDKSALGGKLIELHPAAADFRAEIRAWMQK